MDSNQSLHEKHASGFNAWLLKKGRLERGQKVLASLIETNNYFNDATDEGISTNCKTKDDLLDDLILCAVAIDCSIDNLQSKSADNSKKSMKASLRKWLIQQCYSFDDITVPEEKFVKFSENAQDMLFTKDGRGSIKMYSCAYSTTKDMTSDQRIQNSLFNAQYNRKWDVGRTKLHQKCTQELDCCAGAESKSYREKPCHQLQHKVTEADHHIMKQRCESKDTSFVVDEHKEIELKADAKIRNNDHKPKPHHTGITAEAFGVSQQMFQNFLYFGIRRLIAIEKECQDKHTATEVESIALKKVEAQRAHERWLENKTITQKQMKENKGDTTETDDYMPNMESCVHLFSSRRLFNKKHRHAITRNPAPKIWLQRTSEKVIIHWSSLHELISSDFFIISMGKESDGSAASKVWRDPPQPGGKKIFMKEIDLCPSSSYWINIRVYTSSGSSPEARLVIPCSPSPPTAPILLKATDASVKISWVYLSINNHQGKRSSYTYTVEICIDDENDVWMAAWKGHNNVATLNGLTPDTGYKIRVRLRNNDGFCTSPGDFSIVYTRPRPLQLANEFDSVGKDFIDLCWNKPNIDNHDHIQSSLSVLKCFRSINGNNKDWIHEKDFKDLLFALGVIDTEESAKSSKEIEHKEGKIFFDQFYQWWKTHVTFTIYLRRHKDDDAKAVYKGKDYAVKLDNLSENTNYYITISCATIRGSSAESKEICILTRPSRAQQIITVHVDFDQILLKILFKRGCKIRVEKVEITSNGCPHRESDWTKIYEGSDAIIKAHSLRPDKYYQFRCQRVNREGKASEYIFSETIKTAITKFQLNTRTIKNDIFTIDCTSAITPGDLICFSEIAESYIIVNKRKQRNSVSDVCIVARVINIKTTKTKPEGQLTMETVWASSIDDDAFKEGTIIERSLMCIQSYELLRMPWVDEDERV